MYMILDKYVERQVSFSGEFMFQGGQPDLDFGKTCQVGRGCLGRREGKLWESGNENVVGRRTFKELC